MLQTTEAEDEGIATIGETLLTAEEYGDLPDPGYPTELVRGRIVRTEAPSFNHGKFCVRISAALERYVDDHDLGHVLSNDSGVITERGPDTVRGADVFFTVIRVCPGMPTFGVTPRWRPMLSLKSVHRVTAGPH